MARSIALLLIFIISFNFVAGNGVTIRKREAGAHNKTEEMDDEDDDDEFDDEDDVFDDDGRVYKNPRNSPSLLCPRDEEQATLLGQKCLRKCSSDEDCKSKKKKCLCDGQCGMSCIKPDRECEDLISPELGVVTLTGRMFGDKATYSCDHGFHLVGLKERVCRADGHWSGLAPACKQNIYCTSPPVIAHARHNAQLEQATFDLDTSLQYQCYNGYVTNGFPRAKCLSIDGRASWFGPDISCEPRSCGPPMDISHGWHAGECYTLSCRVAYQCAEGYELVGRAERYCQPDGTWSPRELPSCVPVECSPPEHPANGKAIYTSNSYNSVVSYECKYGFTLTGLQTRRCGADKKWTGLIPQCKEINCGHPGHLSNGWLENVEAGTGLGAVIIFRCHDHMKMIGNSSTVCQIDGRWRYPLPACLAPCVVPKILHGRTVILESTNETVSEFPLVVGHVERLTIDCEDNYEMALNNTPVQCNNGTWSHIPTCVPARCKSLPKPPKNGIVIAPKTEHGMKALYKCRDGYTLRGANLTECYFGNWTGEPPHCQQVYCPFPGVIEHGRVMLVGNMGLYDYRPYVRKVTNNKQIMYECDKGYALTVGPPGATCIGGQWSPQQLPKCEPGMHPRLRWQRSVASKKEYLLMRMRKLERFSKKHKLSKYLTLKKSKKQLKQLKTKESKKKRPKRSVPIMSSEEDDDDEDEEPSDESVEEEKRKRKTKRALLMGHQTQQRQMIARKDRGRDSKKKGRGGGGGNGADDDEEEDGRGGEVLTKVKTGKGKVPCEELKNEPHFLVSVVKFGKDSNVTNSPGTVVQVTCSPGYGLNVANATARCARGEWKPAKPECQVLPCALPYSEHGLYRSTETRELLDPSAEILSNQTVDFSCSRGYTIQGPATLRCWLGQWDINAMPECHPLPCELPVIEHGSYLQGYRAGLTIGNATSVQFTCDEHYTKSTKEDIECVLGMLMPRAPACRARGEETWFKAGSDITVDGGLSPLEGEKRACAPPARVQGSLIYKDGEPMRESDRSFPDATEVRFHCVGSLLGDRTTWRIVCEDGSWVGRSSACDLDAHLALAHERNSSCAFRNSEPNVVSFFNDQQITEEVVEFPSGAILVSRCSDIGKYAFNGASSRKCVNGRWNAPRPVCFGLNQENDYALEKPPTILFRHQLGPIAQSNDGKLIVYPGTILHMECLWIRRFGTPKWQVSHEYRKYPEGWTTDPGRDSQLEYRLSIMHAAKDDSGLFTCIIPTRHTHAVEVVVKAVHCEPLPQRRGLTISTQSTKMNAKVLLSCSNGNALIGSHELTCLPSGNWSAPMPLCQSIECADLTLTDGNLHVSVLSREVGGRAVFSCATGFGLTGPSDAVCLPSGDWSGPIPVCQEVTCADPGAPENGYVQGVGPYTAGAVVQFNCNPDFMMKGQPIIACQETGRWSGTLPKCVQACSYPGTTIKGRMSAVKFYYQIGENITFSCDEGLTLRGASMLKCLKSGKWSNAIPTCILPQATSEEPVTV